MLSAPWPAFQDVGVVEEPVEQGRDRSRVAQHLAPVLREYSVRVITKAGDTIHTSARGRSGGCGRVDWAGDF